jgi:lipopolysaccharide biosynthesis regulator YciM
VTLVIIVVCAVIGVIIYFYVRGRRQQVTGHTPYQEALVALLDQDEELALRKFIEAVSIDSDLIDAYIRLGDLYRKKGDLSKAIQIHQSLTVRAILKKKVEKEVYYALVRDFMAIKRPNKAISYLKEILKIDKKDKKATDLMLNILEDMEHYADCIAVYEDRSYQGRDDNRLAFYYAMSAQNKIEDATDDGDEEKEALGIFKKALRTSPHSLTALYHLAGHFEQRGDLKKAREYYSKIANHHPGFLFLIIPRLERIYFELGFFDEVISIYEKVFDKTPENFAVGFALANLYEKKSDLESARDVYHKLSDKYPRNIMPHLYALRLTTEDKTTRRELGELIKGMNPNRYRCKNCGFEKETFSFICAQCHSIESFLPYL